LRKLYLISIADMKFGFHHKADLNFDVMHRAINTPYRDEHAKHRIKRGN